MFGLIQQLTKYRLPLKEVVLVVILLPVTAVVAAADNLPKVSVYLVSHGWHAGIVLNRQSLADRIAVLKQDFANVDYLEIGWGDRDFYQTPEPNLGHIVQAGLFPSESVLHLVGFNGAVTRYFPHSEIIELKLTPEQLLRLSRHIAASFATDSEGKTASLGSGLYGYSRFYRSTESYHIFNTCNVWTARALKRAGLTTYPSSAITVDDLMGQLRDLGRVVQPLKMIEDINLDNSESHYD